MKKMQPKRGKNMTKIQAHRGACSERPENTMAAFRRAIELHADGIETDVALLADGSLIIHHDDKFGRTVPALIIPKNTRTKRSPRWRNFWS